MHTGFEAREQRRDLPHAMTKTMLPMLNDVTSGARQRAA
jgi:hypothetical protein